MIKALKEYSVYILSAIFIVANALCVYFEFYYLSALPLALALIYMAFYALDKLMLFIVFFTPLSLNLENLELGGLGMYMPTEPLMFGIMLLFVLKVINERGFNREILYHPITLAVTFNLVWIFITAIASEMPLISLKFFLARMWFVVTFYFVATQLFRVKANFNRFIWCYVIPMCAVIIYSVVGLTMMGFDEKAAHWVMDPFFKDHTSYGAIIAMFIPLVIYLLTVKHYNTLIKFSTGFILVVYALGCVLSYTRAAWVSLLGAAVLFVIYKLKIKFRFLAFAGLIGAVLLYMSWPTLMMKLEKNRQDSSGDLAEHVQSISNISSDASNLERINRWESALNMWKERPVLGWGPGTYTFLYAPFQLSKNKTIISTNAGDLGNAHSEYIGPLAEQGIPGMLSIIVLVTLVFVYGSRVYHSLPKGQMKSLVLALLLGLFTYWAHGLLNNYLDTDKASVPVWGFIAMIVAIDIYHKKGLLEADPE